MKRELAIAGIALVVSILLSSPSIAQTSANTFGQNKTKPASEPTISITTDTAPDLALEEMSLDDAILFASSPEDRMRVLMRCAGPRPVPLPATANLEPASESAAILAQ